MIYINVKRWIIFNNFILSTLYVDYNEMFIKAQKIRRLFWHEYNAVMRDIDVVISPNAVWDTPKIDSIMKGEIDPVVGEYSMDYFIVPSNVSGAPAMCLPIHPKSESGKLDLTRKLPVMYKLWGKYRVDLSLIKASKLIDSAVQSLYK